MDVNEYRDLFSSVKKKYQELKKIVDIDALNLELNRLREFTVQENFWNDNKTASSQLKKISLL